MNRRKLRNALAITAYLAALLLLMPLSYYDISAWLFLFPVFCLSVVLILYKAFPKTREKASTVAISGIVMFALAIHYLIRITHFCAWRDFGTLYVNRNDPADTLVLKGFSCFLTDDDTQLFEERKLTEHLTWTIPYYKKPIDNPVWAPTRLNFKP